MDRFQTPTALDEQQHGLVFTPRGFEVKPSNLAALFRAIGNVLEALVKFHSASWMHRDVRWANVAKRRDGSDGWLLVDFTDAAHSPQLSDNARHLMQEEHAPEIRAADSHSVEAGIWSVGHLIASSDVGEWFVVEARADFVRELMRGIPSDRPNAQDALERLHQLEHELPHFSPPKAR